MRKLIMFVVVIAAAVFSVGYYRGWFIVDRERIHEDTQKAVERVKETSGKILEAKPPAAKDQPDGTSH